MSESQDAKAGLVARMRRWFGSAFVADVPAHVAACEFECRAPVCNHGKWESCENRLQGKRSGEK